MNFFLKNPAKTFKQKAGNILIAFIIYLAWVILVDKGLGFIDSFGQTLSFSDIPQFFYVCIIAPLWEELYYRYVPIAISRAFNHKILMPILIFSAVNFGLGHGDNVYHLFIQGVMGMVLSWVYIKNGYSYWSSVTLHFLWNLFILIMMFLAR